MQVASPATNGGLIASTRSGGEAWQVPVLLCLYKLPELKSLAAMTRMQVWNAVHDTKQNFSLCAGRQNVNSGS